MKLDDMGLCHLPHDVGYITTNQGFNLHSCNMGEFNKMVFKVISNTKAL